MLRVFNSLDKDKLFTPSAAHGGRDQYDSQSSTHQSPPTSRTSLLRSSPYLSSPFPIRSAAVSLGLTYSRKILVGSLEQAIVLNRGVYYKRFTHGNKLPVCTLTAAPVTLCSHCSSSHTVQSVHSLQLQSHCAVTVAPVTLYSLYTHCSSSHTVQSVHSL